MTKQNIENTLKEIIGRYAEDEIATLNSNANLQFDIGLDSFSLVSMVGEIETTFDISIPDEELSQFSTINDVVGYIESNA